MMQKKLRFLVDVGVSKNVEQWLSRNDCDVKTIRELNPRMSDMNILSLAVSENRMVMTMDKDFGELVYHSGLPHAGVLLLRLEDATASEKVLVVKKIITEHADKLMNNFCVYQDGKLRMRK